MKISIVISSFNEEESLHPFGKSLILVLGKLKEVQFEVIWVNDGSTDQTQFKIAEVATKYRAINVTHVSVEFSKNFGHEAAMISGIDIANGEAVICMDADGQHPPNEIPKMISLYQQGNDYILMHRKQRKDNSAFKKMLSELFYRLINALSEINFQSNSSDFFLISKNITVILKTHYREKNRFIRGFIQSLGFPNTSISFVAPKRSYGESHYSYKKLFKLALSAIFTFSFKPLRLSIYFATLFILLTLLLFSFSLYQYYCGKIPPSGYTTIILLLSFSFASLFSILSIHLLYFEKLIEEFRQTPLYIIKNQITYPNLENSSTE